MRQLWAATAAIALLALGACGGEVEEASPEASTVAGGSATEAAASGPVGAPEMPAASTAQGFAMRAALSDMFEIQSSQLALERSQQPQVRQFAQRMINEHQTMTNQLQSTLQQANITMTPPAQLDPEKTAMIQRLRDAGPGGFDDAYLEQQIESHETTLNLFRDYGANGDNPTLRQFAERGAPMIENHLQTARAIDPKAGQAGGPAGASAPRGASNR